MSDADPFSPPNITIAPSNQREIDMALAAVSASQLFPQMPDIFQLLYADRSELIPRRYLTLRLDEAIVGFAGFTMIETDLSTAVLGIFIDPDFRNRGIGGEILENLCALAHKKGATQALTKLYRAQPIALRFAERHRFSQSGRSQVSVLSLNTAQNLQSPFAEYQLPDGTQALPLTQLPRRTLADRLVAIWNRTQADQPRDWPFEPFSARRFEADILDGEGVTLAHSLALLTPDQHIIGLSLNAVDDAKRVWTHFTGIDPNMRGRGLGLAFKAELIRHAQAASLAQLAAENDAQNRPMRRINAALGFQQVAEWITLRRSITG